MHNRSALASQPLKIRTAARMVGRKRWPHLIPFCSMKHIHDIAWHEKLLRFFVLHIAPKFWKQHFHRRIVLGAVASSSERLRLSRGPHFKLYYCTFNTIIELEMFLQLLSIQYFSRTRDVLAKIDIIPNLNRSTADLICAGHSGSWVAELDHPGWSTSK